MAGPGLPDPGERVTSNDPSASEKNAHRASAFDGRSHNSGNMPSCATSLPMIVAYRPSCKRPSAAERHSSPAGAGFATPVWCGASCGPNPTSGQCAHKAGTQRKTSRATDTRPTAECR